MTIQLRTKSELEVLLKNGQAGYWKISNEKIDRIIQVEIFQFDGKRVLKGEIERNKTYKAINGSTIIGFKNAKIVSIDHKWIGQNPIKYIV